jgi:hypothetical protein
VAGVVVVVVSVYLVIFADEVENKRIVSANGVQHSSHISEAGGRYSSTVVP